MAGRWHVDSLPNARIAEYNAYKGDKEDAFWYFDKQMAQLAEDIYAQQRGKKKQYLSYASNGELIPFQPKHFYGYVPQFKPDSDGVTFHLSPVFTNSLHTKVVNNHAISKTIISRICGPVEKLNDTTFRVQFYRMGLNNPRRTADICMMASNDGDKTYKSAVQQLLLKVPYRNKEGKEQKISFDSIPDIKDETKTVALNTSSTSGLKVYFYVLEGPAKIENGKLELTAIPPKTKFPVKVTVVAWQHGRSTEPKVQTSESVTRTFYIQK